MAVITTKKEQLMSDVESALDQVRPHLAVDGGNVELVDVTDEGIVLIKWLGACSNCNMTRMTLKAGIEDVIRGKVASIHGVRSIDEE
ncbi:MAG: NifU family protein [Saprospiraceae bacterium]|nr:NifU family protein [Saprospiraceae bacterium]